jgi:hypothetical protein
MTRYDYDRVRAGAGMPGVFEVSGGLPVVTVIDDILLLAECAAFRANWNVKSAACPFDECKDDRAIDCKVVPRTPE